MVLHNLRCVLVHVPKTGGISISSVLKSIDGGDNCRESHVVHESDLDLQDYFKFCIVRNPWDRFLSCYFYFRMFILFFVYFVSLRISWFP